MLLLLSLLSVATALPQFYPYQGVYPYQGIYPGYYPAYYPGYYPAYPAMDQVASRNLFTLSSFQTAKATIGTSTTLTNLVLTGDALFEQNPLGFGTTSYRVYLNGNNIANRKYQLSLATDCTGTGNVLLGTPVTAPIVLVNGFYIQGTTTAFNVDGTNNQVSVLGKRLLVWDQTTAQPGTIVGCTAANALA